MTAKERVAKTQQWMMEAADFKEPDKVPVGGFFYGWPFSYSGSNYRDLKDDPMTAVKEYVKCFDDFEMDFCFQAGLPTPVYTFKALGNNDYALSEDGTYVMHQQALTSFWGEEFYDEITEDPEKFFNDTFFRFKCPSFRKSKEEAYADLKQAAIEFKKFQMFQGGVNRYLEEEKGVYMFPFIRPPLMFTQPFQPIFMQYRGIHDSLVDLIRRPDKVHAAVEAIWNHMLPLYQCDPTQFAGQPFPPGMVAYHPEAFLSPKQFDDLFFKYFKQICLPVMEQGKKYMIASQGNNTRTLDRFRELPKGSIILLLDTEDPFEAHELVGDWVTLVTGLPIEKLATGTVQECKDYVKKSFDTFAPGGGFWFMTNQALLSSKDAKIENVLAAFETANELSIKR